MTDCQLQDIAAAVKIAPELKSAGRYTKRIQQV
jgi:hypothetical protein